MATIARRQRHGRTVYQAKIRLAAGSTSATFDKLTDAKQWAAKTETEIRRGTYFEEQRARVHTLGDAIDRYLVSPAFSKLAAKEVRRAHLEWWRGQEGTLPLARFGPDKVAEGRDKLLSAGKAPATTNRYLAALSAAMTRTVRELGWIAVNPCTRVDRLTEDNARERVLTNEEFERLRDACNPDVRDLVVLALYTAARRSELTELRWPRVDLRGRRVVFKDTKNGIDRGVALVGPALEVLRRRFEVRRPDTDLVFPGRKDPCKAAGFREAFNGAVRRAGLDGFLFHELRHTALTWLAENGATLSELQQIAGHKTLAMVARYKHLTEDSTRGVLERMAARHPEGIL